jgi:exopolysaccharide biosynthesis predicted pyruvyltransferase EpsI
MMMLNRLDEYSELLAVLRQVQPFWYFPSSGNGGDALISHATFDFFRRHGLQYQLYCPAQYDGKGAVVIGGGGGFVDGYRKMSDLVQHLSEMAESVVILPSSCLGYEETLAKMDARFHFFARESVTAEHVASNAAGARVSWCHDMAISFQVPEGFAEQPIPFALRGQPLDYQFKWWLKRRKVIKLLRSNPTTTWMLRGDRESKHGLESRPMDNFDVSHLIKGKMDREDRAASLAQTFCHVIAMQKKIVTDRLHVSIACGLLGIPCEMRANSYHKNRAIYDESIRNFFPCVAFSS